MGKFAVIDTETNWADQVMPIGTVIADADTFAPVELFQKCSSLTMECDDCDLAAMGIKSLFRTSSDESYDTYILE